MSNIDKTKFKMVMRIDTTLLTHLMVLTKLNEQSILCTLHDLCQPTFNRIKDPDYDHYHNTRKAVFPGFNIGLSIKGKYWYNDVVYIDVCLKTNRTLEFTEEQIHNFLIEEILLKETENVG